MWVIISALASVGAALYAGIVHHYSKKKDRLEKSIGTLNDIKLDAKELASLLKNDISEPQFRSYVEVIRSEMDLAENDNFLKKLPNKIDIAKSIGTMKTHIKSLQEYYDKSDDSEKRYQLCMEIVITVNSIKYHMR